MNKLLIKAYKRICNFILKPLLIDEFRNPRFTRISERIMEYTFTLKCISSILPSSILDVGTGNTSLPHVLYNCGFKVVAADNIIDFWTDGFLNRHYLVINDSITNSKIKGKFDVITCISVLEHIHDFNAALKNMVALLNPKGHIILTFPYNEEKYFENIYDLINIKKPYICQIFSSNELEYWLNSYNLRIVEQEFYTAFTGDYWNVGERFNPRISCNVHERQLCCVLLQKND